MYFEMGVRGFESFFVGVFMVVLFILKVIGVVWCFC